MVDQGLTEHQPEPEASDNNDNHEDDNTSSAESESEMTFPECIRHENHNLLHAMLLHFTVICTLSGFMSEEVREQLEAEMNGYRATMLALSRRLDVYCDEYCD